MARARRETTRRLLARLDDRILDDIGVSRHDLKLRHGRWSDWLPNLRRR